MKEKRCYNIQEKKSMLIVKNFINAGIHLGHKTNKWNAKTASYLYGIKNDVHIIDLEQTIVALRRALRFIKKICKKRGYLLYVPISQISLKYGTRELFAVSEKRSRRIAHHKIKKKGPKNIIPLGISRNKLSGSNRESMYKGCASYLLSNFYTRIEKMKNARAIIPEALFILKVDNNNAILIKEAIKLQIPIIGVIDSDSNPFGIQYGIPGNDDSITALKTYKNLMIRTMMEAQKDEALEIAKF